MTPSTSIPSSSWTSRGPVRARERGFSFVEILVVMGIIGVLTGIGLVVYGIVIKKAPIVKTQALLQKLSVLTDHMKSQFGAYPPTDLSRVPLVMGLDKSVKWGKPQNTTNTGIETLYQCLYLPGFTQRPDFKDTEFGNLDEDLVDKVADPSRPKELYEILDAWGNPIAYFDDASYATADKTPHDYIAGAGPQAGQAVQVKPWRGANGQFAQPGRCQIFSWGPDNLPNTEDDLKAWE